jgi:hypothetical protein
VKYYFNRLTEKVDEFKAAVEKEETRLALVNGTVLKP